MFGRIRWAWLLALGFACRSPSAANDEADASTTGESSSGAETTTTDDTAGTDTGEDDGGFLPKSDMLSPDLGAADSHAEDMQPIWSANCILYCHAQGMEPAAGELDLYDGAYANLVGQPSVQVPSMALVQPGEPDQSYLWHKLNGTHLDVGGEGDPMPAIGTPLDDDTLARIEAWIVDGAQP